MKKLLAFALALMLSSPVLAGGGHRGYGHGHYNHGYRPAPYYVYPGTAFITSAIIGGVVIYNATRPSVVVVPAPVQPTYIGAYYCAANNLPYPTVTFCPEGWYWR